MEATSDRHLINASWLIKLRWVAVVGQVATILITLGLFKIQLPTIWVLIAAISVTVASNLVLMYLFSVWSKAGDKIAPSSLVMGVILLVDLFSLTALLFATGGPNNPFSLFYFVNVSLSALVLNRKWAWGLNVMSIICFAALLFDHYHIEQLDMGLDSVRNRGNLSLQHLGLMVAFTTCSSVIVYFLTRLTDELRQQQLAVRKAEELKARYEKIEALETLAAGAAHELATPLSTIAIVAKDVEKAFEKHPPNFPGAEDVVEDVHLIRSQLDRCRGILDRMSSHAGETIGEQMQSVSMEELIEHCLEGLLEEDRVQVSLPRDADSWKVKVPLDALSQAIRGLIKNAIDADESGRSIRLHVLQRGDNAQIEITDWGPGMPEDVLQRISEPFFTTKAPGKGMGLGVFLAINVLKSVDGDVKYRSKPGQGTTAMVTFRCG
jgi:two-component system sensor histidine kinase RegB